MQPHHPLRRIVVVGQSGSGKSTWAAKFLANEPFSVRYIWDPEGEWSQRFQINPCVHPHDMREQAPWGWVIFDPGEMFDDFEKGFDCFMEFCLDHASKTGGTKIVVVDEMQNFVTGHKLPDSVKAICTRGRRQGLDSLFITSAPNTLHNLIRSNSTERVVFHMDDPANREVLQAWGFDADECAKLKPHRYISRTSIGGEFRG